MKFFILALIGFTSQVNAKEINLNFLSSIVNEYYSKVEESTPPDCVATRPTCLDAACDKLGSFGCDSQDEINRVNLACRGNYNGNCINVVCFKLGSMGCDRIEEVTRIARACVGNHETGCFESACRRLGSFGCNDIEKVEAVLKSCAGF